MRLFAALLLGLTALAAPAAAQVDPKNALLERSGWEAVNAGDARAAAEAFRSAIVADPRNAILHLGAGVAAFLERRDADARLALERALDLDPKLLDARVLLGQVLYRMGDATSAMRQLERAVASAPSDTRIAEMLGRWRREAELHDRMRTASTSGSRSRSKGRRKRCSPRTPWSRSIARTGGLAWRCRRTPIAPISVVLYTGEQFHDITRSPAWAAGAYDGRIRVPMRGALEDAKELDRVLAHEFAHALVNTLAPRNVPTWLNEGLATALEADSLGWARDRVGRASAPMSLTTLRSSFGRLTGDQAQLAYATSALAVRAAARRSGRFCHDQPPSRSRRRRRVRRGVPASHPAAVRRRF